MNPYEQLILALKDVKEQTFHVLHSKEEELTPGQLFLLFRIHQEGSMKTTDISRHFSITPGAATAIADKLENLGLIERSRDSKDRRVIVISLSEKGVDFILAKKAYNINKLEEVLTEFPVEEILATVHSLNKISAAIKTYQTQKQ